MLGAPPMIGLGTWQLRDSTCRRVVAEALSLGYRHIDTAQGYENEQEVGRGLLDCGVPREEVQLTTKVWPDHLAADAAGTIERSLERLGVAYVDLLLLHWPSPSQPLEASLLPLLEALDRGWTRSIGLSNFPVALLQQARQRAPITCNQIELHPYLAQPRLLLCMRELGVQAVAYSPLACGRTAADPLLGAIGARHDKSACQVALRWLLQRGIAAVPKASAASRLRANLDVFDFELSEEELASIDRLARGLRLIDPDFAPRWDDAGTAQWSRNAACGASGDLKTHILRRHDMSAAGSTETTTDHETIREWVEERGGSPATVADTGEDGSGVLRIEFPGYGAHDNLEQISWEEFFDKFDRSELALLYQDRKASGEISRFSKFVRRDGET